MKCCGNCFGDKFLTKEIERMSSEVGSCSFCNASEVAIVSPSKLIDSFERLLDVLYKESGDADSISLLDLLKSDWELFYGLGDMQANRLIDSILPELNSTRYKPVVDHDTGMVLKWDEFREELKHENRFFPQKMSFRKEHEGKLFAYLAVRPSLPLFFYRARLLTERTPYNVCEMGKPPCEVTSNGRANPSGIPYLYVATDEETAVAEIRPFKSASVCVAKFELTKMLTFANLCDPRSSISPFLLIDDDEGLQLLRRYMPFLVRMGEELRKPVSPHKSNFEYLPTQYLCEFLKHSGFHGVMYKSSVGSGLNYAIFDDTSLRGVDVSTYKVDKVNLVTSLIK